MTAKITKKNTLNVQGSLDLTDGFIMVEVEDHDQPVSLAELAKEYEGKDIKITIAYGEEL